MLKIIWKVQCLSAPPVSKYCKKCGKKTEYISSGQFRVNAHRKNLDIWLIYKCLNCKTTWNITIFTKTNPKSLDPGLLEQFHNNDEYVANRYAMDIENLRLNGGEIGIPDYEVIGDTIPFNEDVELHIETDYPSHFKVSTIIREKLKLSQKLYEDMITNGCIKSLSTHDLRKCRLLDGIVLIVSMRKQDGGGESGCCTS
ncbi:MAG: DUF1062 domain-containing protein [Lachnospiraceae bacterium]